MPMIPTSENGASADKFFTRQSGKSTKLVNPSSAFVLDIPIPIAASKALKVSAKTIEYVRLPAKQSSAEDAAMIQAVDFPRVLFQASAYEVAPVMALTRAIMENVYAEVAPMSTIRKVAGINADGALPNSATPAERLRTPAPTMHLTRLKISFGMVAVPPFSWAPPAVERWSSRTKFLFPTVGT